MNPLRSRADVVLAVVMIVVIAYAGGILFKRVFWDNRS